MDAEEYKRQVNASGSERQEVLGVSEYSGVDYAGLGQWK
jgi:hypothetical protein